MSVQRNLWTSWFCTAVVLMMGALPSVSLCQLAGDQEVAQTPAETIEEIVVYGDKSLGNLRREVYRTEENFFAVFSSLNDEEEYDIRYFYEMPSFTHIRRHVCRANFVTNATSAEAKGWRTEGPRYPVVPARTVIMQKKRHLGEKMEKLAAEHPELLEALNEYTNAKQVLQSEKKKCEGQLVVCRR